MDSTEQAERIAALGKSLDYEQEALEGIRRSWVVPDPRCQELALADAQAWALLHLARKTGVQDNFQHITGRLFHVIHKHRATVYKLRFESIGYGRLSPQDPTEGFFLRGFDLKREQSIQLPLNDIEQISALHQEDVFMPSKRASTGEDA